MGSGKLHGREREAAELKSALRTGSRRVVWICGPPAAGKSRLAAELLFAVGDPPTKILVLGLRDASGALGDLVERLERSLPEVPSTSNAPLERFALACDAHGVATIVLDDADGVRAILPDVLTRLLGLAPSLRVVVTARAASSIAGAYVLRLEPLDAHAALDLAREVMLNASTTAPTDRELAEVTAVSDGLPGAVFEAASALTAARPKSQARALLESHLASSWSSLSDGMRDLLTSAARFEGRIDVERLERVVSSKDAYADALEGALRDGWLVGGSERGTYRMLGPLRGFVRRRVGDAKRLDFARVVEAGALRTLAWKGVEDCSAALDDAETDAPNLNAAIVGGGFEHPCEMALRLLGELAIARGAPLTSHEAFSIAWRPGEHPLVVRRELLAAEIEIARGEAAYALRRLEALPPLDADLRAERDVLVGHAYLQHGEIARGSALIEPYRDVAHVRAAAADALGYAAHLSGKLDEAARLYLRSESERVARSSWTRALRVRNRRAFLAMDQGRADEASELLESLLVDARAMRMTLVEGTVLGYLGNLARDRRDFERARTRYREGRAVLRITGETKFERTFAMDEATLELLCHRPRRAIEILAPISVDPVLPTLGRLRVLVGCYLLVARAMLGEEASEDERRMAEAGEDRGLGEIHQLALRAQAIALGQRVKRASKPPKVVSPHITIARELVARLEPAGKLEDTDIAVTREDEQRVWFGGKDVSAKVVGKQLRIALRLLRRRIENPGVALSSAALIEAGWPGDRSARAAAENRLRVALSALRSAGLSRVLERTADGYRLTDSSRIALVGVDLDEVVVSGLD